MYATTSQGRFINPGIGIRLRELQLIPLLGVDSKDDPIERLTIGTYQESTV
jgi:hypothetical protein